MPIQSITGIYSEFEVSGDTAEGDGPLIWYPFGLEGFISYKLYNWDWSPFIKDKWATIDHHKTSLNRTNQKWFNPSSHKKTTALVIHSTTKHKHNLTLIVGQKTVWIFQNIFECSYTCIDMKTVSKLSKWILLWRHKGTQKDCSCIWLNKTSPRPEFDGNQFRVPGVPVCFRCFCGFSKTIFLSATRPFLIYFKIRFPLEIPLVLLPAGLWPNLWDVIIIKIV